MMWKSHKELIFFVTVRLKTICFLWYIFFSKIYIQLNLNIGLSKLRGVFLISIEYYFCTLIYLISVQKKREYCNQKKIFWLCWIKKQFFLILFLFLIVIFFWSLEFSFTKTKIRVIPTKSGNTVRKIKNTNMSFKN